jgi:hypothetical protein
VNWLTLSLTGVAVVVLALALMFATGWPWLRVLLLAGAALAIIPWTVAVLTLLNTAIQKGAGQ